MSVMFTAREGFPVAEGDVRVAEFPVLPDNPTAITLPAMGEFVRDIRPGEIVFSGEYVSDIVDGGTAELLEVPEHAFTRQASQHSIVFGQLLIESAIGEVPAHVAVKPLSDAEVAREYLVADYFHSGRMPKCDTFPPLGIMRFFDGQAALVTQYMHEVKSSDNVLWNPNAIGKARVVNAVLGRAGVEMATVHENGWILGDPQAKNMTARWLKQRRLREDERSADTVFVNDLEAAQPISHLSPAEQHARKLMDVDIFLWSAFFLGRRRKNPVRLPEDFPEQVKEAYGLTYVGSQNGAARRGTALTIREISELVELEQKNKSIKYPVLRQAA